MEIEEMINVTKEASCRIYDLTNLIDEISSIHKDKDALVVKLLSEAYDDLIVANAHVYANENYNKKALENSLDKISKCLEFLSGVNDIK